MFLVGGQKRSHFQIRQTWNQKMRMSTLVGLWFQSFQTPERWSWNVCGVSTRYQLCYLSHSVLIQSLVHLPGVSSTLEFWDAQLETLSRLSKPCSCKQQIQDKSRFFDSRANAFSILGELPITWFLLYELPTPKLDAEHLGKSCSL